MACPTGAGGTSTLRRARRSSAPSSAPPPRTPTPRPPTPPRARTTSTSTTTRRMRAQEQGWQERGLRVLLHGGGGRPGAAKGEGGAQDAGAPPSTSTACGRTASPSPRWPTRTSRWTRASPLARASTTTTRRMWASRGAATRPTPTTRMAAVVAAAAAAAARAGRRAARRATRRAARRAAHRAARRSSQARAHAGRPRRGRVEARLPSIDQQLAGPKPGQPSPAGGSSAPVAPLDLDPTSSSPRAPPPPPPRGQRRQQQGATSGGGGGVTRPVRVLRGRVLRGRASPRQDGRRRLQGAARRGGLLLGTLGRRTPREGLLLLRGLRGREAAAPRLADRQRPPEGALPSLPPRPRPRRRRPPVAEPAPSTAPPLRPRRSRPSKRTSTTQSTTRTPTGRARPPPPRAAPARALHRGPCQGDARAVEPLLPSLLRRALRPRLAACSRAPPSAAVEAAARRWRRASPSRPPRSRRRRSTRASRPCWSSTSTPPCRATPTCSELPLGRRRAPRGRGELLLCPSSSTSSSPAYSTCARSRRSTPALSRPRRGRNHALALGAARCLGLALDGLEPSTLDDAPRHEQAVLRLVWQLTRHALLARLRRGARPSSCACSRRRRTRARRPRPSACCSAGSTSSCASARARARRTPTSARARWPTSLGPGRRQGARRARYQVSAPARGRAARHPRAGRGHHARRARAVLADAWAAGVQLLELEPADLRKPRMALAFAAALLNLRPRCCRRRSRCRPRRAPPRSRRSARSAARAWLCSLRGGGGGGGGPAPPPRHLLSEGSTGLPPLRAMDALRPGQLDWGRVDRTAAAAADARRRARRRRRTRRQLRVRARGGAGGLRAQAGRDLGRGPRGGRAPADAQPLWQLQRASMLQSLAAGHGVGGGAHRVGQPQGGRGAPRRRHQPGGQPPLASARRRPLLGAAARRDRARGGARRRRAAAPRPRPPTRRPTPRTRHSCAHALGLPFFSRWQDLAEARPKVAMALLAALAAEDVRRTRAAAGPASSPPPSAHRLRDAGAAGAQPVARAGWAGGAAEAGELLPAETVVVITVCGFVIQCN